MINATFRPLTEWPIPNTRERRGTGHFKSGWNDTLDVLEKELGFLAAKDIVIQIETTLDQIRNDGWPRSDARVSGPKVAITFGSKYGQLTYRCDDCAAWIHNVRCIAFTLQRLRMAEMYGVTKRGEQYQGFKRLGAAIIMDSMGVDEARAVLAKAAKLLDEDLTRHTLALFYKCAAMETHPDRPGGNDDAFKATQAAYETLKRHFGENP